MDTGAYDRGAGGAPSCAPGTHVDSNGGWETRHGCGEAPVPELTLVSGDAGAETCHTGPWERRMTRAIVCFSVAIALWFAMAGTASAQAAVEAGLGAGRAATTAAPAQGIGKSMSGLAGALDRALKSGQPSSDARPSASTTVKPAAKAPALSASAAPAPTPNWEDPAKIDTGLGYDELVRRFGPPAMAISDGTERSLTYRGKDGIYQFELKDEVVASIVKPQR